MTGVTPDPTGETGDFYIPLLDVLADTTTELSDNIIQSGDISVITSVRKYGFKPNIIQSGDISVITSVRKYGFKPYDVVSSFGSAGLTFSPILSTDAQAS